MSSNKRKKIEEYHDPDYCQVDAKKPKASETDTDRNEKIKAIIRREFLKEINDNEEQISLVDHKLTQAKRLLQRVRYAVVMSYYTKKNLEYSANELKCEKSTGNDIISNVGQQTAIHPSLKKLLGKKPIDYEEILKSRSPRNAAKTARNTLIKSKRDEKKKARNDVTTNEMKIPRYISPIKTDVPINKINSARGRNQTSHLIVVGNTSKFIGDEKSVNEVTHKWLVYIKTKTAVVIEEMVSKVRFFLHPSYKPNDVIEVDSPPFQISRRGWGEFPIRVQLYFHDSVHQKPLQIYHNLILDKKMTGLQTMGAETVVEVWLDIPLPKKNVIKSDTNAQESNCRSISNSVRQSSPAKASMHSAARQNLCNEIEKVEPVKLPINIKKEECLIINDTPEIQSQEIIFENNENPFEIDVPSYASHSKKMHRTQSIAQGCLNEISDIFKDTTPTPPKIVQPIVKLATEKPKTTVVQQKKTLVRCLDSNGKIIFVELQVDPKNPKNIKIIKNSSLITPNQPGSLNQSKSQNVHLQLNSNSQQIPSRPVPSTIHSSISNVSIPSKQCTNADAINTTIANPKPITVQSSSGLVRFDSSQTNNPTEKKKFFIIQSSGLANVNSTNPPPLVRISDPIKTAPNMTTVKTIQTAHKSSENRKLTINTNNVIMKNGQIIILDRDKSHTKPKQESLLKPQISLLKPRLNNSHIMNESIIPKPLNSQTATPSQQLNNLIRGGQYRKRLKNLASRDYHAEFSSAFLRHRFQSVRSAVEYILRTVPLINTMCSISDFSAAFPFVVESEQKFNDFMLAKRQSNEWYRAKWLIRMLQQHPDLKQQSCWLPREIIIFSRQFGYTPSVVNKNVNDKQLLNLNNNQNPLKDLIKKHIKDERLKNVTITFNNRMNDFIRRYDDKLSSKYSLTTSSSLEFIDVDNDPLPTNLKKVKIEPLEERIDEKLVLDVSKIMQSGSMLVNDICRDIQIKLEHEEIVEGVLCLSSQLMVWQAMRSFLEDLIRRSFASKPVAEQISNSSTERSVHVDDLKKAISTTDHFGFLTNKHLGRKSS